MKLDEHPAVRRFRELDVQPATTAPLDAAELRQLILDAGADDVGFVEIERTELGDERDEILRVYPRARALISFVVRMNRAPIRSPARSVANLEFHHTGDQVNDIARHVVGALEARGIEAVNPSMGFPMEVDTFPDKIWIVSHKPVAVAAGLGMMGIHRNVIHPKFGNFILLGTILLTSEVSAYDAPVDYNPCLECKLCVAACPVGAIEPNGDFHFSACYTHNYREFMGGFTDWTEQVVESTNAADYRRRVSDAESTSMWQSLSFGANYKAAYCISVCPAGDDVIGPYLTDKQGHLRETVKPLQEKEETIYVLENSDAREHVARRFANKRTKVVGNSLRPGTIRTFLLGAPHVFQPGQSKGMDTTYHFTFVGSEERQATFVIRDQCVQVSDGHEGTADLRVTADSDTWLSFLRKEANLAWALLTGKIRLGGSPKHLMTFGRCFPR